MSPNGTHRSRATRAIKSNRLKTWSAHHGHFVDGPIHQQHPRLPNPSRFTGFVVREHLASDERGRSASQSSCGESFPIIIGSSAPWAASAWPQTYLVTAGGPPEKKHCGRTEQERRLLLALPWWYNLKAIALSIDATIQMNTHRASAAAPRPKGAANETNLMKETKETHDWGQN